jgi:hypothetical protein
MYCWNREAVAAWVELGENTLFKILDTTIAYVRHLNVSPEGKYVVAYRYEPNGNRYLIAFLTDTADEAWRIQLADRLRSTWFLPEPDQLLVALGDGRLQRLDLVTGELVQEHAPPFDSAPKFLLPAGSNWIVAGQNGNVARLASSGEVLASTKLQRGNGTEPSFDAGALSHDGKLLALVAGQAEVFLLHAESLVQAGHLRADLRDERFADTYYKATFSQERPEVIEVHGKRFTRRFSVSNFQELPLKNSPAAGGGTLFKHDPEQRLIYVKLGSYPHRKPVAVVPPCQEVPADFDPQQALYKSSVNDLHLAIVNETGTIAFASAVPSEDHPFAPVLDEAVRRLNPPPTPLPKTKPVQRRPLSALALGKVKLLWSAKEAEVKAKEYREPILVAVRGTPKGDLRLYCLDEGRFEVRSAFSTPQVLDRSTAERWILTGVRA